MNTTPDTGPTAHGHKPYVCKCEKQNCQFCEGGLYYCIICGGGEGSLTTDCCGRRITDEEENRIYNIGNLDFQNGKWVMAPNACNAYRVKEVVK